jgi:hypothetical protein
MSEFYGYPTRRISSPFLELDCLEGAGPRIVGLSYKGSPSLFAEVPHIKIHTPYGEYRYLGGHRLWHAPEALPRSYIPDSAGLAITTLPDGLVLDGNTEPGTGIRKRIEIHLDPQRPAATLVHTLANQGLWEVELAPWALTMFRLGGTVILPLQGAGSQPDGLLPDRHISLWPYSRLADPRLRLEDDFILLEARPQSPPFKIGAFAPQGWIAYWRDGLLFRKTFAVHPALPYPDLGCNVETYCDGDFVELESLGPLARLAPGESVTHTETWELYDRLEQDFLPEKLVDRIRSNFH